MRSSTQDEPRRSVCEIALAAMQMKQRLERSDGSRSKKYNPVVTLKEDGEKTPLFLVHPGVGEILVFFALSKEMDNRPIYALRARGFDGEEYFSSIEETVDTYLAAIKQKQPNGPYAIAGYSFGTMIAFEIAKRLELDDEVAFMGSFNLPPHIKWRMRQLDWTACLVHLCYFLGLLPEEQGQERIPKLRGDDHDAILSAVLELVDQDRFKELSLTPTQMGNWSNLAYAMQATAVDYDPSGSVDSMDIFYAIPLKIAAKNKKEWRDVHLAKWQDFTRTRSQFHSVGGAHYTMLGPDHVQSFAAKLKGVLAARGL